MLKFLLSFLFFFHSLVGVEENRFVLITSLYNETDLTRRLEYLECLERNLTHPNIKAIHVFYDGKEGEILSFLKENLIEISYCSGRPTFSKIFKLANHLYPNEKIIIANGDIYFDETLNCLNGVDLSGKWIALTRWDVLSDGKLDTHPLYFEGSPNPYSHDTWIFTTPIKNFDRRGIGLGTAYCDSYITYLAYKNNYKIFNPSLSIVTHHQHISQLRHWKLEPKSFPDMGVPACSIDNIVYTDSSYIRVK